MLPSAIITVRELILWEYAKLRTEEARGVRHNWLFNLHNFEQLNSDRKMWLRILSENTYADMNKCAYCGAEDELSVTRIVPKKMCKFAEAHNVIRACKKCNESKSDKDLLEWWPSEAKDSLPLNMMARYLKILYICYECNGALDESAFDKDGNRDISYLRKIFKKHCNQQNAKL